jgi:hypothetical protein
MEITNRTRKTTKKILAILAAPTAIVVNPKSAPKIVMIKKIMAQYSIPFSDVSKRGARPPNPFSYRLTLDAVANGTDEANKQQLTGMRSANR